MSNPSTHMTLRVLALSVATLLAAAASARAQTPGTSGGGSSVERAADALEASAAALLNDRSHWLRAARLYIESARGRPVTDMRAIGSLSDAGRLLYHLRRYPAAREAFEEAADRAIAIGDVEGAAWALLYAAYVAEQQRDAAGVTRLASRALLLASSPVLDPATAAEIRSRIETPQSVVATASSRTHGRRH